jgi:3D (Asp-Asp-Asp) domain-containing protein
MRPDRPGRGAVRPARRPEKAVSMLISRSFKRKLVVTCGAAFGFSLLYEATMFDSRSAARQAEERELTARPAPGLRLRFNATAYCKGTTTAAGTSVQRGIAASDPDLLPVGSVIYVDSVGPRYNGIYTVMDTGPAVNGREVDLYMWNCNEALSFGRRSITLTVLRLGWNPRASSPKGVNSLFKKREQAAEEPAAPPEAPRSPGSTPAAPPRAAPAGSTSSLTSPSPGELELGPTRRARPRLEPRTTKAIRHLAPRDFAAHAGDATPLVPSGCRGRLGGRPEPRPRFLVLVLQLIEAPVDAPARQQILVGAHLAQLALVQHEDVVHVLDRREPVGNGNRRAAGHQDVERVADQ